MKQITLVFRKKLEGRESFETVFKPIEKLPDVNKVELPCELDSLRSTIRLFVFAQKIKGKYIHTTGGVQYLTLFLFWKRKRFVITIHDANRYEALTGIRKYIYGLIWFKIPIQIADRVVFISPPAAEQVKSHFYIREEKIEIIPNSFRKIPLINIEKENKFSILAIGTKTNKNLERLFEAVKGEKNIKLHIVGKLQNTHLELLAKYKIAYSNYFNIDNNELDRLYNMADMLYFASTKEGFGLPIIEAQSCGLPVLTSNTTSMPYVAGDAALIVDPYNIKDIKHAIFRLQNDTALRNSIVKKGFINLKRFDEESFINKYKKIYESII